MSKENNFDYKNRDSMSVTVQGILQEQAFKLGEALTALRSISRVSNTIEDAKGLAANALKNINEYGKDDESL